MAYISLAKNNLQSPPAAKEARKCNPLTRQIDIGVVRIIFAILSCRNQGFYAPQYWDEGDLQEDHCVGGWRQPFNGKSQRKEEIKSPWQRKRFILLVYFWWVQRNLSKLFKWGTAISRENKHLSKKDVYVKKTFVRMWKQASPKPQQLKTVKYLLLMLSIGWKGALLIIVTKGRSLMEQPSSWAVAVGNGKYIQSRGEFHTGNSHSGAINQFQSHDSTQVQGNRKKVLPCTLKVETQISVTPIFGTEH